MSLLSSKTIFAAELPSLGQAVEWHPGVVATHNEIFAAPDDTAGAALALAFAREHLRAIGGGPRTWLWVQDREALRRTGRPYRPGLPAELRHRLIHVATRTVEDTLFALEEGLRCRDFAFVLGEVAGNSRTLDLTASRRLGLAAQKHGVPFWLVRIGAQRDLSSARQRWEVRAATSPEPRWNPEAPGIPTWHAELFRARRHPPGTWTLRDEGVLVAEKTRSTGRLAARHA